MPVLWLMSSLAWGAAATPGPNAAGGGDVAARGPLTFDSFKLVRTRNVFDPERRPPVAAGNGTPAPATGRADYAALTGTLLTGEKSYAFFSGSRAEFNKVLSVHDLIANATIAEISAQSIAIERDGKRTTVNVGQTVPLDNQSVPGAAPLPKASSEPGANGTVGGEVGEGTSVSAAATSGTKDAGTETNGTATVRTPRRAPYAPSSNGNNSGGANNGSGGASSPGNNPSAVPSPTKAPPANLEEIRRRMMEKRQQELK